MVQILKSKMTLLHIWGFRILLFLCLGDGGLLSFLGGVNGDQGTELKWYNKAQKCSTVLDETKDEIRDLKESLRVCQKENNDTVDRNAVLEKMRDKACDKDTRQHMATQKMESINKELSEATANLSREEAMKDKCQTDLEEWKSTAYKNTGEKENCRSYAFYDVCTALVIVLGVLLTMLGVGIKMYHENVALMIYVKRMEENQRGRPRVPRIVEDCARNENNNPGVDEEPAEDNKQSEQEGDGNTEDVIRQRNKPTVPL